MSKQIEAQYGSIAERKRKFKLNKPKGETMSKQAEELWASDFHGKEYIKSMKASDRAELLELMVTRKWGETK